MIAYGNRDHLPVTCSDDTRVADVNECPNYYAASGNGNSDSQDDDDSSAGRGGGGGGGGGSRSPVARSPAPPATAGASIADDVEFVKACADEGRRGGGPPHVFEKTAWGNVNVSYGDAGTGYNGNPAQGRTVRTGARSVSITMDFEAIKYNGGEVGRNYWRQFAKVLLHEYHHADDMLSCKCSDPDVWFKLTRQQYENETEEKALADLDSLFGGANAACLAD